MRVCLAFATPIVTGGELYEVELLRTGSWSYDDIEGGGFDIKPTTLQEIAKNFNAGLKGRELPVNLSHDEDRPVGWIKSVRLDDANSKLYVQFSVDADATRKDVDDGLIKYVSAELDFAWVDPEAKRTRGDDRPHVVLEGMALTNHPYIKGMQPIMRVTLTERKPNSGEPPAQSGRTSGEEPPMPENNTDAQLAESKAQLDKTSAELADTKARLVAQEERTRRIERESARDKFKGAVDGLVREKRLTPAIANRALALAEVLIDGDATVVKLGRKVTRTVHLADGKTKAAEVEEVDVLDDLKDLLKQLPSPVKDEADLEEDESDEKDREDKNPTKAADMAAKKKCAENPKLRYSEVYLAELKARGVTTTKGNK